MQNVTDRNSIEFISIKTFLVTIIIISHYIGKRHRFQKFRASKYHLRYRTLLDIPLCFHSDEKQWVHLANHLILRRSDRQQIQMA